MKKYVVDTSLINKLVDGAIGVDELPTDGPFVASHVQRDELSRTKDAERRAKLLEKFTELIDEFVPTESFVLDTSPLGGAKLRDGSDYEAIKRDLDLRNKGKRNNVEDALIAQVALKNGYTLLTADFDLYQVVYSRIPIHSGIGVIYWAIAAMSRPGAPNRVSKRP